MANSNLISKANRLLIDISPAPWFQSRLPWHDDGTTIYSGSDDPHAGTFVATTASFLGDEADDEYAEGNAAFIAEAPELVRQLVKELETERRAFDLLNAEHEKLRRDLSDLERRNREKSGPIVDVLNILAAGNQPTTEQIRAAHEAYKWAVYGVSIGAQIVIAATKADESVH